MKTPPFTLHVGEALATLRTLPADFVQTCVTSTPYWRMRDYNHPLQIGLEKSPDAFVAKLVDVFREVRRVLRPDGTLWLNIGDGYACSGKGSDGKRSGLTNGGDYQKRVTVPGRSKTAAGLKRKDLVGVPWMLAFALRADGWFLRSDIIWAKPNPMPSSISDRPTTSHEHVFLFSRSSKYLYNAEAIASPVKAVGHSAVSVGPKSMAVDREHLERSTLATQPKRGWVNARDVWTISSEPYDGPHFAPMPSELARRCIVAGAGGGALVLDPFAGAGTTGLVALREGRRFVGIELNPEYAKLAEARVLCAQHGLGLDSPRGAA